MIDLAAPHLEIVKHILTEHVPQYTVWVFGSRVGGVVKPHSDLDLAVVSDRPLNLNCLMNLGTLSRPVMKWCRWGLFRQALDASWVHLSLNSYTHMHTHT